MKTWLVINVRDAERDGVDGGISKKVEALEYDLLEQSVQMRM